MKEGYEPPRPTKAQRNYNELERIRTLKERLWRRIMRTANAYEKLCKEERKLLKRDAKPAADKPVKGLTGKDWHEIREVVGELDDAVGF